MVDFWLGCFRLDSAVFGMVCANNDLYRARGVGGVSWFEGCDIYGCY